MGVVEEEVVSWRPFRGRARAIQVRVPAIWRPAVHMQTQTFLTSTSAVRTPPTRVGPSSFQHGGDFEAASIRALHGKSQLMANVFATTRSSSAHGRRREKAAATRAQSSYSDPRLVPSSSESALRRLNDLKREWSASRRVNNGRDAVPIASRSPEGLMSHRLSRGVTAAGKFASMPSPPRNDVAALIDATTLDGKRTVQRIAREESIRKLKPWTQDEPPDSPHPVWTSDFVRRFRYRPETPEFTSRALVTLVEEALLSHQQRVDRALSDAARARMYATQAEMTGWERIEEELQMFKDPETETAVRQAVRAFTSRANKEASKLRAALVALEQETAWSQESNNTAMRVVATKLLAQHDASVSTVLAELEDTEAVIADVDYRVAAPFRVAASLLATELDDAEQARVEAVRQLEAELRRVREENKKMHAGQTVRAVFKFATQRATLEETERRLAREQHARDIETRMLRKEMHGDMQVLNAHHARQMRTAKAEAAGLRAKLEAEQAMTSELRRMIPLMAVQLRAKTQGLAETEEALHWTQSHLSEQVSDLQEKRDQERDEYDAELFRLRERNAHLRARTIWLHATIHGIRERGEVLYEQEDDPFAFRVYQEKVV